MPDWSCVSSPPEKLHVSRPPNERPWGLWNLSHSSHKKSEEEGHKISQIRGHTRPRSIKWACDFNQCWIRSPSSDRATRAAGCRDHVLAASPILPWTRRQKSQLPSLREMERQAGCIFSLTGPTHPLSQAHPHPRLAPQNTFIPLGMPGSHLPLCPTYLGSHPWGLLVCSPQARKFYSAHWCLLLTRPCVI